MRKRDRVHYQITVGNAQTACGMGTQFTTVVTDVTCKTCRKLSAATGNQVTNINAQALKNFGANITAEMGKRLRFESSSKITHSDDVCVEKFAAAMKAKLAKKRAEGCGGWESCPVGRLRVLLDRALVKEDPVDIGNYAMMIFNRLNL